jgi:hypothetical protein
MKYLVVILTFLFHEYHFFLLLLKNWTSFEIECFLYTGIKDLASTLPKNVSGCARTEGIAKSAHKNNRHSYALTFHSSFIGSRFLKQTSFKERSDDKAVKELPVGMNYR